MEKKNVFAILASIAVGISAIILFVELFKIVLYGFPFAILAYGFWAAYKLHDPLKKITIDEQKKIAKAYGEEFCQVKTKRIGRKYKVFVNGEQIEITEEIYNILVESDEKAEDIINGFFEPAEYKLKSIGTNIEKFIIKIEDFIDDITYNNED